MRILALDYGSVTVGVAVTDALGLTAQPLRTIRRGKEGQLRATLREIADIVGEYGVSRIVLGLPLNMDGTEGPRAAKTREFKTLLEARVSVPVILFDERLTTAAAQDILDETNYSPDPRERKRVVDQIAAQLILEDYMSAAKGRPEAINGKDKTDR